MRKHRSLATGLSCLVAAALLAVPSAAFADDHAPEFRLVKAQRPLALTPGKLRVDLPFTFRNIPAVLPTDSDEVGVFFGGGLEYGILKGLTVGGEVLNVRLNPDADYLNPSIFALYQFVFGNFELGGRVRAHLPSRMTPTRSSSSGCRSASRSATPATCSSTRPSGWSCPKTTRTCRRPSGSTWS